MIDLDTPHRREYENAIELAGIADKAPKWEDLSDFHRETIREANREYWAEMKAFGDSIADGTIQTGLTVE